MDRRTNARIDLQLSCRIEGASLISENSGSTTENISRNGLLLRWQRSTPAPPAGSRLRVELELPSDGMFAPRVIRCESTVVRATRGNDGRFQVALKVDMMRFVEDHARPRQDNFDAAIHIKERVN